MRSEAKADDVRKVHHVPREKLDFVIVKDITSDGAFDQVIQSDPPFEVEITLLLLFALISRT